MENLDFAWGNPYFLLENLQSMTGVMQSSRVSTMDCSYAPDFGDHNLIRETKKFIQSTTGKTYPHVFITHGATGALSTILKEYRQDGFDKVATPSVYGYPFYDKMIEDSGLIRVLGYPKMSVGNNTVHLIDSPSNPEGKIYGKEYGSVLGESIWDSVYHNPIYIQKWNRDRYLIPNHSVLVGSYSKVLGLTGARVGFVATDDDMLYKRLSSRHLYELATISVFTQKLILNLLLHLDMSDFMLRGKKVLNGNRGMFQGLEKYFADQPVQENGMFYFAQADQHTRKLLAKCEVKYVDFSNDYVRMNLGQTTDKVCKLIARMKKEDKV